MAFLRAVDFLISDLEARERARARPGAVAAPSRRVLVVDDNVDSAVSLAVLLRNMRHYVEVVHDGHAALSTARAFRPDFVLLDIGLPGLDGFQVAAALRRDPGLAAATIVAVTGLASESDRRRSAEAGFDHYLVKPLDVAYIASLLGGGLLEYRRAL